MRNNEVKPSPLDALHRLVTRRPLAVTIAWIVLAVLVVLLSPNLSRLAAEGQARLVPDDAESLRARELIDAAWPDQAYQSVAVVALHRPGALVPEDHDYAQELAGRLMGPGKPAAVVRMLGPDAQPEVASYLLSDDHTSQLVVFQLDTSFVAPVTQEAVAGLRRLAEGVTPPPGLEVYWTGDAVFGQDYMAKVDSSLHRAELATVVLLLIVLLAVYRSLVLALIPLATIAVSLLISRGVLAWMTQGGWEISPLVELFLVVVLFGCGTDFGLLVSWRFGENWNPADPAAGMRRTLQRTTGALLTSAGTTIVGLSCMAFTRFKLFSSTGPSVAIGLAVTVVATLTLTPALLVMLARVRPQAFAGLTTPSTGFWDGIARQVLHRPLLIWGLTVLLMAVPAGIAMISHTEQDLVAELPRELESVRGMRLVAEKFGAGRIAPLTVLFRMDHDLGVSEGMVLIDDVSRILSRQRRLLEVRSATQPLGSPKPFEPARMSARLETVREGFQRMQDGAVQLQQGLNEGAAKLRTAILLEELTGVPLTGSPRPAAEGDAAGSGSTRDALVSGLKQAYGGLFTDPAAAGVATAVPAPGGEPPPASPEAATADAARDMLLRELGRAAEGAGEIAEGAQRAQTELTRMLNDPVGQRALDRLLITPETVTENPDIGRSLRSYISQDGRMAKIELMQADRLFSPPALDQVIELRRQLRTWVSDLKSLPEGKMPEVLITGANAQSADIRTVTRNDQVRAWFVIPLGVFLVLLVALRDVLSCLNLVLTMVLTYCFSLGITHAFFVWGLGAPGIDWKVPYFLFVLLVAVGVDYNVFLMARLQEEAKALGLRAGIIRSVAQTGGLISSAAAITACSFASFLFSPLSSLRQLGFALVVGIAVDALLVRPVLVPCGHWLLHRSRSAVSRARRGSTAAPPTPGKLARIAD